MDNHKTDRVVERAIRPFWKDAWSDVKNDDGARSRLNYISMKKQHNVRADNLHGNRDLSWEAMAINAGLALHAGDKSEDATNMLAQLRRDVLSVKESPDLGARYWSDEDGEFVEPELHFEAIAHAIDELDDLDDQPMIPKRIDLAAIMERMDQSELVVALIAINPELEDILPDDDQLKKDVANVRQQLAQQQLRLNENPAQVGNVVHQNVHIHLWDEKTSERVRELGAKVVDLFENLKEKLVETKAKYFDGDGRDVITFEEAYAGFQVGLRGMTDFITRRDRSAEPTQGPWPADAPDKASADQSDPKIKWWGYVLANFGAVPSKEYLENLQLKRDAEATKDVVRLASSAVDEVLDDDLEPVPEPVAAKPEPAPVKPQGEGNTYSFGGRTRSEPEEPMDDFFDGPPPPEDDTLYVVRSSTPNSPHYITDQAGKNTYDKSEAAQFPLDEAERLAGDHSDYAATKGYGYRYQIEEAGPVQAQQLRAGAGLSQ